MIKLPELKVLQKQYSGFAKGGLKIESERLFQLEKIDSSGYSFSCYLVFLLESNTKED